MWIIEEYKKTISAICADKEKCEIQVGFELVLATALFPIVAIAWLVMWPIHSTLRVLGIYFRSLHEDD